MIYVLKSILRLTQAFDSNTKKPRKLRESESDLPIVGCTLHEALEKLGLGERVFIDDG